MDLLKRVIIAVIFIPILLGLFYWGGIALASFLGMVVIMQMSEIRKMMKLKDVEFSWMMLPLSGVVFIAAAFFELKMVILSLFLVFFIVMASDLFRNRLEGAVNRIAISIFAVIYTAVFMASVYRISTLEMGKYLTISLLVLIWITDTCAYFIGMTLGKHRGVFKASPKKSIEGFIAGIVCCFGVAFIIAHFVGFSLIQTLALAIAAGLFGQMGDLFESVLKRDIGVKDSSGLLPGHGGVLDRFDSLMIAAPVCYLILTLF